MSSEVPVTPEPAGETPPESTPAEKAPEGKPEPDYKAAFTGLQENLNKSHARTEQLNELVRTQQAQFADALAAVKSDSRSMRTTQNELVRATLGEDKARELAARDAQYMAQEAARRAASAAQTLLETQAGLFLGALAEVGIDPKDPDIDWAQDAGLDVAQWGQRVGASVRTKIAKTIEARIAKERDAITQKSAKEIKAEAEALAERAVKASGVDKIDTAKGQGNQNFVDRVRNANPDEMARMIEQAKSGRLRI